MSLMTEPRLPTYRIPFNFTAVAGVGLEITNPSNSGVSIYLLKFFANTDSGIIATVNRRSAAATGGTSAAATPVPSLANQAASAVSAKAFTAAPTPGTLVDNPLVFYVTANLNGTDSLLEAETPLEIAPGVTLSVTLTAGTVRGYLAFAELPTGILP